ncbi:MAG: hypothetical protein R2865_05810 [Deinococcales bacterium]
MSPIQNNVFERGMGRAQCQPGAMCAGCRLPYELMVDGELKDLGTYRYLLSPGDLYALKQVPNW